MKSTLLFLYSLLLSVLVSCSPPKKHIGKPNIYLLKSSNYYGQFYVFDNFQDNENCIKYLFNFAEKNKGYLIIMTNKNTYEFDDGVPFIVDTVSNKFAFSREDNQGDENNTRNFHIRTKSKPIHINFKIEQGINKDKLPVKKLSTDFDSLNVNIVQNFLDYSFDEDYKARKQSEKYIYELYNKKDSLKIRQVYHNFGKWFEVEIL